MLDYKQVAVYKERQQHKQIRILKMLLYNAIVVLEEEQVFDTHMELLEELGMSEKEYKEIMGE